MSRTKKQSTEAAVREIRRKTRRKFAPEEKVRIVLEGLRGEQSISESCRREGIASNLYYRWSKDFLEAGKSVRWVADQLGHSSPILTLKTYAHAMPEEEVDLSFASFGDSPRRPYTASNKNGAREKLSNPAKTLVELRGIEPLTLRLPERKKGEE